MTAVNVTARLGNDDDAPSATVEYDFGDNLDEAVKKFGADVVYARFKNAATVDLQALIRRHLDVTPDKEGNTPPAKSAAQIQELATAWKPGVLTRKRKSTSEKFEDLFGQLSEADKAAMLEKLMSAA